MIVLSGIVFVFFFSFVVVVVFFYMMKGTKSVVSLMYDSCFLAIGFNCESIK